MEFLFRPTTDEDFDLYLRCFKNEEFQNMMYYNSPIKVLYLKDYIAQNDKDFKLICSVKKFDRSIINLGFVHIYYKSENLYSYVGGILPQYFNSGLGLYASAAMLSYLTSKYNSWKIQTTIYKHNIRSLKIHLRLGFKIISDESNRFCMELTPNSFRNDFSMSISSRITATILMK